MFPYDVALLRARSQPANLHSTLCERWCDKTDECARPPKGGDPRCPYGLFSHKYDSRLQQTRVLQDVRVPAFNFITSAWSLLQSLARIHMKILFLLAHVNQLLSVCGTRFELLQKSRLTTGRVRIGRPVISQFSAPIEKIELSNRVRAQQIVDAADRQSPVTDCKSHPLGSTAAAIATGKYSRQARLECLG